MIRSIDSFLSQEEQDIIAGFIEKCQNNFGGYDTYTREPTSPIIDKGLEQLVCRKKMEWGLAVDEMRNRETYKTAIKAGKWVCPINEFFLTIEQVIKDNKSAFEYKDTLEKLKYGISICKASCPCPAGKKD